MSERGKCERYWLFAEQHRNISLQHTAHADQRFEERDIVKRQFQAPVKSARNPRVSEVPLSDEQVDPGYDEGNALEMLCHEHVGRARLY